MRTLVFFLIVLVAACSGDKTETRKDSTAAPRKLPVFYSYDSVDPKGDSVYLVIAQHQLLSHTGDTFSLADIRGKVFVADFFFTRCKNICPMMSAQLRRVQNYFANNDGVRIVSYSIDPENDTAAVLSEYAGRYEVKKEKWLMLTGDKKTIYDLARNSYRLAVAPGDGGPGDFIHSEQLVLVDPDLHIRGYYDGTDSVSVDGLMDDIHLLLKEFSAK